MPYWLSYVQSPSLGKRFFVGYATGPGRFLITEGSFFPSLCPLSESNAIIMELAKALKGRNQPSNKLEPSPAFKRTILDSDSAK